MISEGVAKILIFLIVIAIVFFLSITVYKRLSEVTTPTRDTTLTQENITEPCKQDDINVKTICKIGLLAKSGYIQDAKNLCESLEGNWRKTCDAKILAVDGKQDKAKELCKEIEYSIPRNSCILNVLHLSGSDNIMEFCLSLDDNDESSICVAQALTLQGNRTGASETCTKIENSTMKDLCANILEMMLP